jgi:hypothetical protein
VDIQNKWNEYIFEEVLKQIMNLLDKDKISVGIKMTNNDILKPMEIFKFKLSKKNKIYTINFTTIYTI